MSTQSGPNSSKKKSFWNNWFLAVIGLSVLALSVDLISPAGITGLATGDESVGCGGTVETAADTPAANGSKSGPQGIYVPNNVACEKSAQNGIYEAVLIRDDGNCPDFTPFFVEISNGEISFGGGCEVRSISFTEGECVQESTVVCVKDQVSVTFVSALAQLEESGSILVGVTSMSREVEGTPDPECNSGYRFKVERVNEKN